MKVKDLMIFPDKFPVVKEKLFFKEALEVMNEKKLGIACIVDDDFKLKGVLTDGDIRRQLLIFQKPFSALFIDDCVDHAMLNPSVISPESSLEEAIEVMELKQIWDLPVLDDSGVLVGLLHLHPVVKTLLSIKN